MQADPPKRAPPPPIPSYRQHVEIRDEHLYIEVSSTSDGDSGDRALTHKQSTPPPAAHYDTPAAPPRRKTISGRISNAGESSSSTAKEDIGKLPLIQSFTYAKEGCGLKYCTCACTHKHIYTHAHMLIHKHACTIDIYTYLYTYLQRPCTV